MVEGECGIRTRQGLPTHACVQSRCLTARPTLRENHGRRRSRSPPLFRGAHCFRNRLGPRPIRLPLGESGEGFEPSNLPDLRPRPFFLQDLVGNRTRGRERPSRHASRLTERGGPDPQTLSGPNRFPSGAVPWTILFPLRTFPLSPVSIDLSLPSPGSSIEVGYSVTSLSLLAGRRQRLGRGLPPGRATLVV